MTKPRVRVVVQSARDRESDVEFFFEDLGDGTAFFDADQPWADIVTMDDLRRFAREILAFTGEG
jgi:hypothetical protein